MAEESQAMSWEVLPPNYQAEHSLRERLGMDVPLARVLVARGHKDPRDVEAFLTPSLERDWVSPWLLPGIQEGVARVAQAIEANELICVFGDFDVDGMTATSLLTLGLQELGARVFPFIPHRFEEGYGMSDAALERVLSLATPNLVVTVDTGIASGREAQKLVERGIDVVVTDHHEPGADLPTGIAVIDPKLACGPGYHDLAGAGVALKLLQALGEQLGKPDLWRSYLDFAALGTVSDLMPLVSENRALVAAGIEMMHREPRASLEALCAVSNHDPHTIEADDLPFYVVPRLNAPGRMGFADLSLELLLTQDPKRAQLLAMQIETINNERKEAESELTESATMLAEDAFLPGDRSLVVGGEGWHEGVKGVCATRLVSRFGVPVLLFSIKDGIAKGSGRSVGQVDLYHAVEQVSQCLVQFGGHEGAVGVTLEAERLPEFAQRLEGVLQELPANEFVSFKPIDALVNLEDLTLSSLGELNALRPYGKENPSPIFCTKNVWLTDRQAVGRDASHLRCTVSDGHIGLQAIRFRDPSISLALAWDGPVDVVYKPVVETWQGRTRVKLMIQDILYPPEAKRFCRVPQETQDDQQWRQRGARERERLQGLSDDELKRELTHHLIGDHELLPAQSEALDALASGASAMCIMATGRGKSLIFSMQALLEALQRGRATIIVYPLRALVADQSVAMTDSFGALGVTVATLTGESSSEERERVYQQLARGDIDVVLTTPEFLAIHADRFAASGRIGFLVVDEAHHAGSSKGGNRSAYQALPAIRQKLGEPLCLGVTATAPPAVCDEAMRLLGATRLVVDPAQRTNLLLEDERSCAQKEEVCAQVVGEGEKTIVYVSSRAGAIALTRELRHRLPELAPFIAPYHGGLERAQRTRIEDAFRSGLLTCVVATSAFGEGINLPHVRSIVLYHVPYDLTAFNQSSGRAGRDGAEATVHVVFGREDVALNERVLKRNAPSREELVGLWRALLAIRHRVGPRFLCDEEAIGQEVARVVGGSGLSVPTVAAGLGVFDELSLVSLSYPGGQAVVTLRDSQGRVDLQSSLRFLEGQQSLRAFSDFCEWVLSATGQELRDRIIRPITPYDAREGGGGSMEGDTS